ARRTRRPPVAPPLAAGAGTGLRPLILVEAGTRVGPARPPGAGGRSGAASDPPARAGRAGVRDRRASWLTDVNPSTARSDESLAAGSPLSAGQVGHGSPGRPDEHVRRQGEHVVRGARRRPHLVVGE